MVTLFFCAYSRMNYFLLSDDLKLNRLLPKEKWTYLATPFDIIIIN